MNDIIDTTQLPQKPSLRIVWFAVAIVVLDQVTKLLIKGVPFLGIEGFPYGHSTPFIGDIFRLTYIENPGIAFGIHIPAMKVFFSIFSVVASIGIFIYLKRKIAVLSKWETLGLVLILGGAVGNLIDRCFYGVLYGEEALFYGRVVDFIDFGYKENWWPIFNVADSAVSVGVTILAITLLTKKQSAPIDSSTTATKVVE